MDTNDPGPPDAGQRIRQKRRKWRGPPWLRRVFVNRRVLMMVLWVANAIVKLVRIISFIIDGS